MAAVAGSRLERATVSLTVVVASQRTPGRTTRHGDPAGRIRPSRVQSPGQTEPFILFFVNDQHERLAGCRERRMGEAWMLARATDATAALYFLCAPGQQRQAGGSGTMYIQEGGPPGARGASFRRDGGSRGHGHACANELGTPSPPHQSPLPCPGARGQALFFAPLPRCCPRAEAALE